MESDSADCREISAKIGCHRESGIYCKYMYQLYSAANFPTPKSVRIRQFWLYLHGDVNYS